MARRVRTKTWVAGLVAAMVAATGMSGMTGAVPGASAAVPQDTTVAWTSTSTSLPQGRDGLTRAVHPRTYSASDLDASALRAELVGATTSTAVTVGVPGPDGSLQDFVVVASDVMAPALAAAHPEIQTYAGHSVADPTRSIRLDLSPLGFHASVRGPAGSGTWYVDPAYVGDPTLHVSYYGSQLRDTHGDFVEAETAQAVESAQAAVSAPVTAPGATTLHRVFRLALVSDPSYATFFGGAANVTAAKVTLINRVSQIYNDDLAVDLQLVAGNDSLNLNTAAQATGTNGPCGATACFTSSQLSSCGTGTLNRNTAVINTILGSAAYDVGHIGLGTNGGGVAYLGVVGSASQKGGGCTGVTTPVGDLFAVDYVAHELGHQFGADHTFNGVTGSCSGGNREATESVEPGSGSSVMAYAGICGADDLQAHSDPYFSEQSIQTINSFLDTIPAVGTSTVTTNHNPVVTAPPARTIPFRTPFSLTGSATDSDGNPLGYVWEQDDPGSASGTALLSNTKTNGPLFRMFGLASTESDIDAGSSPAPNANHVGTSPTRVFPDLVQVLAGNTNAATGSCVAGNVDCFSEFLPTAAWLGTGNRVMHFRLTARDVRVGGAGVASADTAVTVSSTAGPFLVTSRGTAGSSVAGGATEPITWSVNGTNAAGLAPFVKISLSTDGGLTYPTVLAAQTANDGSRTVNLPNTPTAAARIKIEAVDNYFFDVNDAAFAITAGTTPGPDPDPDTPPVNQAPVATGQSVTTPFNTAVPVTLAATDPEGGALTYSIVTAPAHGTLSGTGAARTYTPTAGYSGPDSFTFKANDGSLDSNAATVSITVSPAPVNQAPVASAQSVTTAQDTPRAVTLVATDPEGGALTYSIVTAPAHGTVTGSGAARTYTPTAGYSGPDSFTFKANDGSSDSNTATVSITVTPVVVVPPDTTAPNTSITSGPGAWVLSPSVTLGLSSTEPGSTFACSVNGFALGCGPASASVSTVVPGSYLFGAAARDTAGNTDASPATRAWSVPYTASTLKAKKGFSLKTDSGAFGGKVAQAKKKGATLTKKVTGARTIVLVATRAKGAGKVKVYLGNTLLKTVNLSVSQGRKKQQIIPVATFAQATSGKVKIVSASGKPVRIEGLGWS